MNCIFCKIVAKEIPSEIIFEDKEIVCFKDINPKADFHFLIVSKKHIGSIEEIKSEDATLVSNMILTARKIARENNLTGYKLLINVGRDGGQTVEHLHLHLLSGELTVML